MHRKRRGLSTYGADAVAHLLVLADHAVLADVDAVLEAELVRHLPLGTLAQAHRRRAGPPGTGDCK